VTEKIETLTNSVTKFSDEIREKFHIFPHYFFFNSDFPHILILFWVVLYLIIGFKTIC